MSACIVPLCGRPYSAKGYCKPHYQRWLACGDARPDVPLRRPQGEALSYLRSVVLQYSGDDCLPWPYTRNGHGAATISLDGRNTIVARFVCEARHGKAPSKKHEAAHCCGQGHNGCVAPSHLRWATRAENEADKLIHGTHNRGERHGCAKLTTEQVLKIREMPGSIRAVGKIFGVSYSTIADIRRMKKWSHV